MQHALHDALENNKIWGENLAILESIKTIVN